jgi:predicted transposase YbfD/YdcC
MARRCAGRLTDAKSNESTASPARLRRLGLEGATGTIDALGWQPAIARQLVEQGADYVLALKGNQPTVPEHVRLAFVDAAAVDTTLPLADLPPTPRSSRRTDGSNGGAAGSSAIRTISP